MNPDVIQFACQHCQSWLTVPAHMAGVAGPCPKCGQHIVSPKSNAPAPHLPQAYGVAPSHSAQGIPQMPQAYQPQAPSYAPPHTPMPVAMPPQAAQPAAAPQPPVWPGLQNTPATGPLGQRPPHFQTPPPPAEQNTGWGAPPPPPLFPSAPEVPQAGASWGAPAANSAQAAINLNPPSAPLRAPTGLLNPQPQGLMQQTPSPAYSPSSPPLPTEQSGLTSVMNGAISRPVGVAGSRLSLLARQLEVGSGTPSDLPTAPAPLTPGQFGTNPSAEPLQIPSSTPAKGGKKPVLAPYSAPKTGGSRGLAAVATLLLLGATGYLAGRREKH